MNKSRAFTLVELLVVIGIIALLIAILLPVTGLARKHAKIIRASSDLRQMLLGYTAYHTENRGQVLWGFPPQKVNGHPVTAFDRATKFDYSYLVAQRYPWRLLPYCSNIWPIINSHANPMPPLPQIGQTKAQAEGAAYQLSVAPTYGINAIFVGGTYATKFRSFSSDTDGRPLTGLHCVFRANEVRNPTRLLVFAESDGRPAGAGGNHYLLPPRADGQRWRVDPGEKIVETTDVAGGVPQGRFGRKTIVGFFDGHVECLYPTDLLDMRYWANKADSPDYDFQTPPFAPPYL